MRSIRAFEVSWAGFRRIVNARGPGPARYDYWLDLKDAYPDVGFLEVKVRRLKELGPGCQMTAGFAFLLDGTRLRDWCRPGARCLHGKHEGTVVDGQGGYVVVEFDDGQRGNVHPAELEEA